MATAAVSPEVITPRFAIGDTIYVALTEQTVEQLPCPDCLGAGKWEAKSPAGEVFTLDCPRCRTTYSMSRDLPSLGVRRVGPKVAARTITGYEVNAAPHFGGSKVEYRASGYHIGEEQAYATEEEAMQVAILKAAEQDEQVQATPEAMRARHFSSLRLDEGKYDEFKNGLWESHYHSSCLLERVKSALSGDDGDEDRDEKTVLDDLRDAVNWDLKHHLDRLPLRPLITAALASSDEAVRTAVEAMPQIMVDALSGKTLDEARAAKKSSASPF